MAEKKIEDIIVEEESKEDITNKTEKRITDLTGKIKTVADERDTERKARETAERERDFFASFADTIAQYPVAKDHKDAIKSKVMAGYTVEDATVSVLAKEGKLNNTPKEVERETPAGGSSVNLPTKGSKGISEMTQAERRQALVDAEGRGDLGLQ